MKVLNRDHLVAAPPPPHETVELPELGGAVIVQGFTAGEQEAFYKQVAKLGTKPGDVKVDEDKFTAKLVVRCLVDDKGSRILKDDDFEKLLEWPAPAWRRVVEAAMRVNGMDLEGN